MKESSSSAVSVTKSISLRSVLFRAVMAIALTAIACACVTFGLEFASAEGTPQGGSGTFGFAAVPEAQILHAANDEPAAEEPTDTADVEAVDHATADTAIDGFFGQGITESFVLETTVQRDISASIEFIESEEEVRRFEEQQREQSHIAEVNQKKGLSYANGGIGVYDVDFSCGRDEFVTTWTARINEYLSGSPLAGYGSVFAEAAWQYGVDPRWSPAISNTESTKGRNCFAAHNAWGWTGGSWSNWAAAINTHVAGLAEIYGYTISYANAERYCPPNAANWYSDTLNEMQKI